MQACMAGRVGARGWMHQHALASANCGLPLTLIPTLPRLTLRKRPRLAAAGALGEGSALLLLMLWLQGFGMYRWGDGT